VISVAVIADDAAPVAGDQCRRCLRDPSKSRPRLKECSELFENVTPVVTLCIEVQVERRCRVLTRSRRNHRAVDLLRQKNALDKAAARRTIRIGKPAGALDADDPRRRKADLDESGVDVNACGGPHARPLGVTHAKFPDGAESRRAGPHHGDCYNKPDTPRILQLHCKRAAN
jgi:hypothetical protein